MRPLLFVALVSYFPAFGQVQNVAPPPAAGNPVQQTQVAAQRAEEAARLAEAARADAERERDETLKRLDAVSADMISRETFLDTVASRLITFVQFAVVIGTFLAVIAAVVTGYTLGESRKKIKQGLKIAREAADKIVEMKGGIERHKLFLNTLQVQVNRALGDIEAKMQVAASTPGTALIGVDLASTVPQRSYDDDALVVFADRLGITAEDLTPVRLSTFLVMFGNYWRRTKEYARAIERIQRALELDQSSATAHKALGRAFWNKVGEELSASGVATSPEHLNLLNQAETELGVAKDLLASRSEHYEDILYDLGMISRYRGQISEAIGHYRQGAQLSKALAQTENREPDWDFEYAIACLYAKTKQYQEALDQVREVIDKRKTWDQARRRVENRDYREWMRTDPDFAGMLADGIWGPQLQAL